MKKLIILILLVGINLLLYTCEPHTKQTIVVEENNVLEKITEEQLKKINQNAVIVEIDGCEYIVVEWRSTNNRGYGLMSHKGNCKNPIHIYNQLTDTTEISHIK
ncbi:hypothetical protein ACFLU5_01015 [Bacteroidota bacterium]